MIVHKMKKISFKDAFQFSERIVGKQVKIESGYAGVLFLKIGSLIKETGININGNRWTAYSGEITLFSEEDWQILRNKKVFVDRWKTEPDLAEQKILDCTGLKILKIIVEPTVKTQIFLEKNYSILIPRHRQLSSWTLGLEDMKQALVLSGVGTFSHNLTVPDELKTKYFYEQKGYKFASGMYALDFYREYIEG